MRRDFAHHSVLCGRGAACGNAGLSASAAVPRIASRNDGFGIQKKQRQGWFANDARGRCNVSFFGGAGALKPKEHTGVIIRRDTTAGAHRPRCV